MVVAKKDLLTEMLSKANSKITGLMAMEAIPGTTQKQSTKEASKMDLGMERANGLQAKLNIMAPISKA